MPSGIEQESHSELQQGDRRGGVPLMLSSGNRACAGLLAAVSLALALPTRPAWAQTVAPALNLVDQLAGPQAPANIDAEALRRQASERIQSKTDATAQKRPPIAPWLAGLRQVEFDVAFDPDTTRIRPQSYQIIGRIADALSDPKLLPYAFLVIVHTEAGRRADNLTLSQRRADTIRSVLVGSFKISSPRLQALGLGEEQLKDSSRPASPANARAQIVSIGKIPEAVSGQPAARGVVPTNTGPANASNKRP